MEDKQRNKRNMGGTVLEGLDNHNFWSTNPTATAKRDELEDNITAIDEADARQGATGGTGYGASKASVKHETADQAYTIAQGCCGLALATNNLIVLNQFDKPLYALLKMPDADLIAFCNNVSAFANANVGALADYNIINTQLTAFTAQIAAFVDIKDLPEENQGDHHSATVSVAQGVTNLLGTLHWWDFFMNASRHMQPEVFVSYQAWRKTHDIAVRHMSIRGTVTASDTGNKLYHAKLTITNLPSPKVTLSGKTGFYKFYSLNPADYSLKVELEGYQTLIIPSVSVAEGQITDLDIALVKV